MHEEFKNYVEALHPKFEELNGMKPVTIPDLSKQLPSACIYLFSENGNHLCVGRTRNLRRRLREHSIPSALHNQAVFAFKLAREATGQLEASYTSEGSRESLQDSEEFRVEFLKAKERVRKMDLRYVEVTDPLRQALLEIYVHVVLRTKYYDFETH